MQYARYTKTDINIESDLYLTLPYIDKYMLYGFLHPKRVILILYTKWE